MVETRSLLAPHDSNDSHFKIPLCFVGRNWPLFPKHGSVGKNELGAIGSPPIQHAANHFGPCKGGRGGIRILKLAELWWPKAQQTIHVSGLAVLQILGPRERREVLFFHCSECSDFH